MSKYHLLIGFLFFHIAGFSQNNLVEKTYTVLDANSKQPVPYATLYNHSSGTGTVTNLAGQFKWKPLIQNDSLTLTFVGYSSQHFTSSHPIPDIILLKPKTEVLESAYVYGNMTFLYELVSSCKEMKGNRSKQAKTYLSLESIINNQTTEKMEAYYNGSFSGYDCEELRLKAGRLAISNFGDRFFMSTETSKALYLHKLFDPGSHFPTSPMGLSKKKLSKLYDLKFVKSYENEQSQTIYQIKYIPKEACDDCFRGNIWIDSTQRQVQRITLLTDSTNRHPFIMIGNTESLLNVSLEITKNYTNAQDRVEFKSTDFNYQLVYQTKNDSVFAVNTSALVYAYDNESQFDLPHFEYGNIRYQDYILIGSLPYNSFFWQNYNEFSMASSQKNSKLFRSLNPAQTGTFIINGNPFMEYPFFEHAYKPWSMKRIQINKVLAKEVKGNVPLEAPPSQQYKLKTQIYMDVNAFNDSVNISTVSYFDPYFSYFYLQQSLNTDAFVNMYFDLTEIKRRELVKKCTGVKSEQQVEAIYQKCMSELASQHKTFVKETQRGNNLDAMVKWNTYIFDQLKIDNVGLFRLLEKPD